MSELPSQTLAQSLEGLLVEGKYQVLEKIGQGGMGVVYRAMHTLMDREVALKVLHSHLIDSQEFLKRFRHEAQVASKLRHPNAVMIYDFGMTGTLPYLVMELVKGDTLKDLIAREGAIPPVQLLQIMDQVFSAVTEAHRLGIVHRDLKPDNFILTKQDDGGYLARVLDFGIAKVLQPEGGKAQTLMTQAGAFFGTPRYASPEQALGKELDPRADIYSLGVILYEAVTGEVPFDAPSMMELLLKHLNQPPPKIRERHPEKNIPIQLEAVILKCLEKDRENRFQNVAELQAAFRQAVELGSVPVSKSDTRSLWILGVVVAAVIGSGAYVLFGPKSPIVKHDLKPTPTAVVTIVPIETPTSAAVITIAPVETAAPTAVPTNSVDLVTVTPTPQATAPAAPTPEAATPEPTSNPTIEPTLEPTPYPTSEPTSEPTAFPTTEPSRTPSPTSWPTSTPYPTPAIPSLAGLDSVKAYKKGDELYREHSYAAAIPYFIQTIAKDPGFKKAHISLGICYTRLKRMDDAFKEFKAAFDIDKGYPPTLFNLACYYALTGQRESALRWLEKTIDREPAAKNWAQSEPDLASIRNDPKFRELVEH